MHVHRLARGFDGPVGGRRLKSALFNGNWIIRDYAVLAPWRRADCDNPELFKACQNFTDKRGERKTFWKLLLVLWKNQICSGLVDSNVYVLHVC